MNYERASTYYSHLSARLGNVSQLDILAVMHMVPNAVTFAPALNSVGQLRAIFAKPKTYERPERRMLERAHRVEQISREWASDAVKVAEKIDAVCRKNSKIVLTDIGGYFSQSGSELKKLLGDRFIGIMEGTENGIQKYEDNGVSSFPLVTVARSPLKLPEDHLVAASLVFSVEASLRLSGQILQTRTAGVVGYGRVGRSVAEVLRGRGINTSVFDIDSVKLAEAAAKGFSCYKSLIDLLQRCDLVICATGNKALDLKGFGAVKMNSVIASVTSSDDEFVLSDLDGGYKVTELSERFTLVEENIIDRNRRRFYLLAGGDAINFLDGAVIGPAMQLIEGEKLACVIGLGSGEFNDGINELDDDRRKQVAETWIHHFI